VATGGGICTGHRGRLLEPIGYIPPAEAEANYWRQRRQAISTNMRAEQAAAQEG